MKNVLKKAIMVMAVFAFGLAVNAETAQAGVKYKDNDGNYIKLGGRIQLQYHEVEEDTGSASDETTDGVFFRRFRMYIEGSTHELWTGKFQFDLGNAEDDNEVAIKDAYMEYKGFKDKGIKIRIGNHNNPFSRELLTSSKKQQFVERTFVGDHNFGTPDRNLGVHLLGTAMDKKVGYFASVASASIDPDNKKLDFDTPVNAKVDFNEGVMTTARVDFHPFGALKYSQGDFKNDLKATVSVAAFNWSNDEDNNTRTDAVTGLSTSGTKDDVDSVTGTEVSLAVRGYGVSVDAQMNSFESELVDKVSKITNGIYKDSETELENTSIEAGYMVIPGKLEFVAGTSSQSADNYSEDWERTAYGLNYFFEGHDVKLQFTVRDNENINGVKDNNSTETFMQMQYVF